MITRPIAWRVRWLLRSSPSPYPFSREFAELGQAEAFLGLVERVFPPGDLALAVLEPREGAKLG